MTRARTVAAKPRLWNCRLIVMTAVILAVSGCATHRAGDGFHMPDQDNPARSEEPGTTANARTPLKKELLWFYARWAGTPYLYGGETHQGVDCSSFVRQAIATVASYRLPRTTDGQVQVGWPIPRSELETGDLVFFKTGGSSRHVGIYLGHNRFMHASSSVGVTISRLDNIYWRSHYWQSRRIPAYTADQSTAQYTAKSL